MKSPFSGMDPYIESAGLWGDFYYELISEIKRALASVLPERYFIRSEERSYIVLAGEEGKEAHPFLPDAGIRSSGPDSAGGSPTTATAIAEPETASVSVEMQAFIEERFRENFIEIFE